MTELFVDLFLNDLSLLTSSLRMTAAAGVTTTTPISVTTSSIFFNVIDVRLVEVFNVVVVGFILVDVTTLGFAVLSTVVVVVVVISNCSRRLVGSCDWLRAYK